jgi:hypothetical protein
MKDNDFQKRLHQSTVPAASESARARARHRALIAFEQRESHQAEESSRRGLDWRWSAIAGAVVIGCLPFLFLHHHNPPENLADDREILLQMEKLFPNRVDAVIQKNGKTDLTLADSSVLGADQPVVVVFQRGQESIRVLSYSGHRVCLDLGGIKSCFEILETSGGGVILEGEDRAWVASQHPVVEGYSVRAQVLEASL